MEHSIITKRRLKDGDKSLSINTDNLPDTIEELKDIKNQLHDGIVALQSLDDLGSEDANKDAFDNMLALQYRYDLVEKKIKSISNK